MDCAACRENLTAYLDGELGRPDAAVVCSHLDACAGCRGELADMARIAHLVASGVRSIEPSAALRSSVRRRVGAVPAPTGSWNPLAAFVALLGPRWAAVSALGATVAIGFGVWSFLPRQTDPGVARNDHGIERYMDAYVRERRTQEIAHRSVSVAPVPAKVPEPRGETGRAVEGSRAHREYSDNPFVTLAEDSSASPFRPEEPKPAEATR